MQNALSMDSSRALRIQKTADRLIDSAQFCGIAWQFAQHSNVLAEGESGFLDEPGGKSLPKDAIYRIYSMTKPMVSVLALQLIEEGVLRLTDPVGLYLPEFSSLKVLQNDGSETQAMSPMLVEHLLTHRSGLSYDFLPRCEVAKRYQSVNLIERGDRTLEEFIAVLATFPLAFEPGSQWRYSVATDVLARLLEVVTELSLPQLLEQRLFKPCGLVDTAFYVPMDKQHRLASLYGSRQLGQVPALNDLPQKLTPLDVATSNPMDSPDTFVRGGHGLFSTTADYQRFLPVLMTGLTPSGDRLLSSAMLDLMWANRIPSSQMPLAIGDNPMPGYGWNLVGRVLLDMGASYSLTLPEEGGWGGAASTYFFVHRHTGLNGVVMTQYLGSAVPVGDDLRSAFLQALEF